MQPILENRAFLRNQTGPGIAKGVRVLLYSDRVEIISRKGDRQQILNAQLSELENVNAQLRRRMIYFNVKGQFYLLIFTSTTRTFLQLLGIIGKLVGLFIDKSQSITQTWIDTMKQKGVRFQ